MTDRITPFDEAHRITERIDEIVLLDGQVHIEMMSGKSAWMRIGNEVFWIHAQKTGLVIRWHETYRLTSSDGDNKKAPVTLRCRGQIHSPAVRFPNRQRKRPIDGWEEVTAE